GVRVPTINVNVGLSLLALSYLENFIVDPNLIVTLVVQPERW
ncbi:4705_t:CDS:1, partial [Racocetra persica]